MPKKRQSTESDEDRRGGSDYDEDEPCFSPASAGGDDGHSNPLSDNHHRNLNSPPLSHLARHNEYRRQRKGLWNQSWNQYRDIQDEVMGIRRRGDSIRGQFYDQQDYYSSPLPSGTSFSPSQYSFTTSNSFPGNGAMDRPNTMLLSSTSSPYTSYPYPSPAPSTGPPPPLSSYDDLRRLPPSAPPSSTTFLTRTNALLSQLTDPTSNNNFPSEGQNKRVKHDHSFDPYASSSSYSVPPAAGSVNGYSSHRSHDYTAPIGPHYSSSSTGSRFDTNTSFAMSASSSSSGSRVPLSSSTGVLSRTEQLLAKSTVPSSSFPSSSSSRPMLSRTEQILAMTSNHQPPLPPPSRPIPRNQPSSSYHSSSSSAPKTSKAQDNKMEATDLFAMLQASGLLPTK